MARKTKLTKEDIFQAEKAKDNRVRSRKQGFEKMHERDKGYQYLKSLDGKETLMFWPPTLGKGSGRHVPEGYFIISIDGHEAILSREEFGRCFRWV